MHQAITRPQRPQGRGSHLIGSACELGGRLNRYAVARADIVQQEVAVRMNDLIAKRGGTVNALPLICVPGVRGRDRRSVASRASDSC